jgi:hypothetical protein
VEPTHTKIDGLVFDSSFILNITSHAVLWLALLSGCTAKWADPPRNGMKAMAAAQLLLSSGIVFAVVVLLGMKLPGAVKRQASKLKSRIDTGGGDEAVGGSAKAKLKRQLSSFLNVVVRAGPDDSPQIQEEHQQTQNKE